MFAFISRTSIRIRPRRWVDSNHGVKVGMDKHFVSLLCRSIAYFRSRLLESRQLTLHLQRWRLQQLWLARSLWVSELSTGSEWRIVSFLVWWLEQSNFIQQSKSAISYGGRWCQPGTMDENHNIEKFAFLRQCGDESGAHCQSSSSHWSSSGHCFCHGRCGGRCCL